MMGEGKISNDYKPIKANHQAGISEKDMVSILMKK
jgi:hypothetical protein